MSNRAGIERLLRGRYLRARVNHAQRPAVSEALKLVADDLPEVNGEARSVVYFIQDPATSRVKIGHTNNLRRRLADLATGAAQLPDVLLLLPGGRAEEVALHGRFDALRERGEWFRFGGELAAFIREARGL